MTEIETDRLSLRPYHPGEAALIHRLISDLRVFFWRTEPGTLEEAKERLGKSLTCNRDFGPGFWAVFTKGHAGEPNAFLGQVFLQNLDHSDLIELGYQFIPEAWGNGYATEAARALFDYGFCQLNLDQIVAVALPDNKPSLRVLQRLDLPYIEDRMHADLKHRFYALSRESYLARHDTGRQEA
jgi:ribosomal-protein-alanine N-acetyltransferase